MDWKFQSKGIEWLTEFFEDTTTLKKNMCVYNWNTLMYMQN